MKKPRKRGSSATREGGNEPSQYSKIAKRFAAGGFKFLNIEFLSEVDEKKMLIDPEPYILQPGSKLVENRVNDKSPWSWTNAVEKHWVKVYLRLSLSRDTVMALLNNFRFDLLFSSNSYVTRT